MTSTYQNYIDGEWTVSASEETFGVHNPADTDDVVGFFQRSSVADVERAIESASQAQESWMQTPAPERGQVLRRTAELLSEREEKVTEALTREEGKTLSEARPEVRRSIDTLHYYAEKTRDLGGSVKAPGDTQKKMYAVKEPLGVASLITPWNYPLVIPVWKLAPALATGNTVVLKPASTAPNVSRHLFECLDSAGVPDGVANLVTGSGSELGPVLSTHDEVDAVSFTGSTGVGKHIYRDATAAQKRTQTEMGGKNPAIVMPSADLDEAAEIVGGGAFGVTGQACTATSRALVHEDCYEAFVDRIVGYAERIDVGPGLEGAEMGPQISESELEDTLEYIDIGTAEGATLLTGGDTPTGTDSGYFVEPTVFADVDSGMRIAEEEIFGPVLGIIEVSDFEEALDVANDVEYGLSASIITQDISEANQFLDEIEAGVAKVNEATTGGEPQMSFGGRKNSSSDTIREQGDAGIEFYTREKTVYVNY